MFPNIPKEVDVVIVGIGPAGSAVAKICAEAGISVLGLEKKQEIGMFKRCGEGLSKSSLERMGIDLDPRFISNEIAGLTVYAPNKTFLRLDFPDKEGWIVERKVFDKILAYDAAKAGAKIIAKANVKSVKRNNGKVDVVVEFNGEEFDVSAKLVVACDGVESKTGREMGLDTKLNLIDVCSCAQFEMANIDIDDKRIELFFGNKIGPGGYVWIFPKGRNEANVGIGVRRKFTEKSAYDHLKEFVESHDGLKKGSIIEVNTGAVPVGGIMDNMVEDNIILAGDAAHQVNPVHGGGIAEAYVGGKIAGEVAIEAIKKNDFSKKALSGYNEKWLEARGKKLKKLVKLRELLENMSDDDLNWIVDYLKGEDLVEFSKGKSFGKLAKILIKKPKLLKFAKSLI